MVEARFFSPHKATGGKLMLVPEEEKMGGSRYYPSVHEPSRDSLDKAEGVGRVQTTREGNTND